MSGESHEYGLQVVEAYFRQYSATAIAVAQHRDGIDAFSSQIRFALDNDEETLGWLRTGASPAALSLYVREILMLWAIEGFVTQAVLGTPQASITTLLHFDEHYFLVSRFAQVLLRCRPAGIDRFDPDRRKRFVKEISKLFFEPQAGKRRFPSEDVLLKHLEVLTRRIETDGAEVEEALGLKSYPNSEYSASAYSNKELRRLVHEARLWWYAPAAEFEDAQCRVDAGAIDDLALTRLVATLPYICRLVGAGKFDEAARTVIAAEVGADTNPHSVLVKARAAQRKFRKFPACYVRDHRKWGLLTSSETDYDKTTRMLQRYQSSRMKELGLQGEDLTRLRRSRKRTRVRSGEWTQVAVGI